MPEPLRLIPISGPELPFDAIVVEPDAGSAVIGRSPRSDYFLPDVTVSRRHARLVLRGDDWFIIDEKSTGGTVLASVQLQPGVPARVTGGDRLRIGAWTFRVDDGKSTHQTLVLGDDPAARPLPLSRSARQLGLLSDCLADLGTASDEETLFATALHWARRGSGLARAAILRRSLDAGAVEVLAASEGEHDAGTFRPSRSLVDAASSGQPAVLSGGQPVVTSESIISLQIHSAVCCPIMIDGAVSAYLYLDARASESRIDESGLEFCAALAHGVALAQSGLERAALVRRQEAIRADLERAREIQAILAPPADQQVGHLRIAHRTLPGLFVSGDFFDIVPGPDGRICMAFGDATGHGFGPAMLASLAQAHLRAEFARHADPVLAMEATNRFLAGVELGGNFVSLWAVTFDPSGRLHVVDAGHGHWFRLGVGGETHVAPPPGMPPIGIDGGIAYEGRSVPCEIGDRIVVYSDGIIEQVDPGGEQFGIERLVAAARNAPFDRVVDGVFDALLAHAGGRSIDDDASLAIIERGS